MSESWIDPVSVPMVEDYIKSKFENAEDIQVDAKDKKYIVTFYTGPDFFDQDFGCVILEEFTTSIEGSEIDEDWISIVRECNDCRTIDGWTYDQALVRSLEFFAYHKKQAAIAKAEEEYKDDICFINGILEELKIKDKIEERQF